MNLEEIKQYREEAISLAGDLQPTRKFSTPQLVDYINERLPPDCEKMTKPRADYLRKQGTLHPEQSGEGEFRKSWRYTITDVHRAILVELLKTRAKLSVQEINVWLRNFEEEMQRSGVLAIQEAHAVSQDIPIMAPPNPVSSTYALLRNRTLGALITALGFGATEVVPSEWFIAIHVLAHVPESPGIVKLTWEEVQSWLENGTWSLAVSDVFSKIYVYLGLAQLRKNRPKINETLQDYSWLVMILQENTHQCYELLLGLPDDQRSSPTAIQSLEQHTYSKGSLQLDRFPGLATLLKAAFVNQSNINEGTTVFVLAEIIAQASDAWDYCGILVPKPSDATAETSPRVLEFQGYSVDFPSSLTDKVVDIEKSLTGWCYRYRQDTILDSTAQYDSRMAFFEEEGRPTAAAALPVLTEEQQVIAIIYVARRKPIGENEKVFSPELIASLKMFSYICRDVIARDRIEVETVASVSQLLTRQLLQPFDDLKSMLQCVAEEGNKGVSPEKAAQSWIYLLTLNIHTTSQDAITQWLCQQGVELTGNFLAYHLQNPPLRHPLPIGCYRMKPDQYVFAILQAVDLPEEQYKECIIRLQKKLNQMRIGRLAPDFYPSAVTIRFQNLLQSFSSNGQNTLVAGLEERTRERLIAGPYFKRGHEALYTADLDQAVSEFDDALRYVPNSWYGHKHLAEARMLQGTSSTIDQAINLCQRAIELNSSYASAYCLLADCLAYRDRFGEALLSYERALVLDSARTDFLIRYGLTLAGMTPDEYQHAIQHLRQEGQDIQLGVLQSQPWQAAIDKFDRARTLSENKADPEKERKQRASYHYQRGYAYLQAGIIHKAVEDFSVGRKLAPDDLQLAQAYSYALSLLRREGNS